MVVVRLTNGILQGLAADTKPTTYPNGTIFFETDTRANYFWDGTYWELDRTMVHPRIKKTGGWMAMGLNLSSYGILDGELASNVSGSGAISGIQRSTAGTKCRFTTGATAASQTGYRGAFASSPTERDHNPRMDIKLQLTQTTNERVAIGLREGTGVPAAGAEPMPSLSGVLFWLDTGVDANWHIAQNSGTASSDITTIANVAAADTNAHIFSIRANNTNTRFEYQYDGGAWTTVNTKIPIATTGLNYFFWMENIGANTDTYDVFWLYVEQE